MASKPGGQLRGRKLASDQHEGGPGVVAWNWFDDTAGGEFALQLDTADPADPERKVSYTLLVVRRDSRNRPHYVVAGEATESRALTSLARSLRRLQVPRG